MAIKRCPWCRTENPGIYDRCIKCGGPLPAAAKSEWVKRYLLPAIVLVIAVIAVVYLVIPTLHLSAATGRNLSAAISSGSTASVPQYDIGQPARYGDLQVAVNQVRTGDETVNNGRFLTVTVSIENFNNASSATVRAGDFVLTDDSGNYYTPTGIGSKVSYEALPGTAGITDLVYFVQKDAGTYQMLYTFPETSGTLTGTHEVAFNL